MSIGEDGTIDPAIVDDKGFLNLKSLCYNFLKFPKSSKEQDGFIEFVHDSARLFFLTMRLSATVASKPEDFSDFANHLKIAKMCLTVIKNSNHPIWHRATPEMSPTDWVQCWDLLERDHKLKKEPWPYTPVQAGYTLQMRND